jgi:uncharacterized SAM-binding protein YcdF (DUF218 family)
MSAPNPRRQARFFVGGLSFLLLLLAVALGGLAHLGHWLVVEDPLAPSRAIVVLSGRMPYRAMEAAGIYRQGFAPEVWLTHVEGATKIMAQLGIRYTSEEDYDRAVLERLGVPPQSIRVLAGPTVNTEDEVRTISQELRRVGGERVILVTSMPHTRRVRTIWKVLVGARSEAIVRYTRADPFDASHWWRNTQDALAVIRETFGLLNAWAGFPLRPRRP